jgi:hypothetical protein
MKRLIFISILTQFITASVSASTSILPNTFGDQKTLVILVNFQDNSSQPITPSTAYSTTFTTASNWFQDASYGQTWLTGDVAGWYTLPITSTCSQSSIQSYADQEVTAAGYVESNYQRIVYVFTNSTCSYWGYSTIGGSPSRSWIDINWGYAAHVITHELGHGFGLYHSHSMTCSGGLIFATSGCTTTEYGDPYDVMGVSNYDTYFYDAAQKERLGWLNYGSSPPITVVATSGLYAIDPYESYPDTNPKALKIAGPSGTYYYLESRQSLLEDSGAPSSGLLVHNYGGANSNYVVNAGPGGAWPDPAGFTDGDSTVNVTWDPTSISSTGSIVNVTFGTPTCTRVNPTISMIGPGSSVAPGVTANWGVTITDNDSSSCSSSSYNLGNSVPSGWNGVYNASSIMLSPGTGTTVSLGVTAPGGTPNGTYSVAASTDNSSATTYAASASQTETIYTAPAVTVSVSTNASTYTAGQTVSISVTLTSGSSPVSGAKVKVAVTKPSGATVNLSGTSGSSGVAVVKYSLKKQDPKGTWQVNASSSGAPASTTFTVQ